MYLIVGLGNPGREYENTRHNVGFMVVDILAKSAKAEFKHNRKCFADVTDIQIGLHRVIVAKPQTYMNESGRSVIELMKWNNISPEHLFVIYDDMDLPVGEIRVKDKGSSAGHHGIESIFRHLQGHNFWRVRVGIGRSDLIKGADYVLARIPADETGKITDALLMAINEVEALIKK